MTQKNPSTYLDLCTEVYELSKPNITLDAYQFYRSYAIEAGGPILEPMCGTGRFLLPLFEEGFDIYGFDASESMLKKLHEKAASKNLKPTVWKGFIEELERKEKYKLIFIPTGSFGLITEPQIIQDTVKLIYDHLEPNGLFVFEVETSTAIGKELGIWHGSRWPLVDGKIILMSQLIALEDEICCAIAKYELVEGNQVIQTEIEDYKIRLYNEPAFLVNLLDSIGFSNLRLVKAFDRSASPKKDDMSIVFECRK
ncbi:acyl-CoA N-acyltransferase [Legionella busanensis]|uniref:Acyl-CoA N-acyltransferase n=1 Tax=Legionella busanensis TaxID=190655 RepID=A0A378JGR1_9GAMM|nr:MULTISPECIES: class I SAM-dependent methyltransferase [Legionella]STX50486.1 acyl-CoA N-acyltransferase [Legionella busanensis]